MTYRVHQHRHRRQRFAVIKTQHLDSWIIRPLRVQTHHRKTVDGLAAVDAKADAILAIANVDRAHVPRRLLRSRCHLFDQLAPPAQVFHISRSRVIVRGGHHDVRRRHAGRLLNALPHQLHHLVPGADGIHRHDRRLGLAVIKDQHTCPQRITHSRHRANMTHHRYPLQRSGRDVHLGHASPQVGDHRELPVDDSRLLSGVQKSGAECQREQSAQGARELHFHEYFRCGVENDKHFIQRSTAPFRELAWIIETK